MADDASCGDAEPHSAADHTDTAHRHPEPKRHRNAYRGSRHGDIHSGARWSARAIVKRNFNTVSSAGNALNEQNNPVAIVQPGCLLESV